MRGENSKYDFLMNSTVEEIESGTRDDFLMGVAEEAVKAAKTVNPSYSRTPVEMLSSIKEAVIIPWIKKDIPHLDYVLYYRDNVYQPLIMPLQPSDPPGDDEVWLKVQKVDSKGRPLASAVLAFLTQLPEPMASPWTVSQLVPMGSHTGTQSWTTASPLSPSSSRNSRLPLAASSTPHPTLLNLRPPTMPSPELS